MPDMPEDAELTEEQKKTLAQAVLRHQHQIHRWMHWHNGAGQNRAVNNKTVKIINNLLKNKMRTKKPWEIYSNTHYKTCILPHIESGMSIGEVNKTIRDIFENESPEVKDQFIKISEEQKQTAKKERMDSADSSDTLDHEDSELDSFTLRR